MRHDPNDKQLRLSYLVLGIIWLSMQLFFVVNRGIETGFEAGKYIDEANYLLQNGHFHATSMSFYATIILLIAICIKWNISFWGIVLVQIVLNAISVVCFYKIIKRLTGKNRLAIAGTFYFLILFDYHHFNTFLFTESLFFSLSVIYTYVLFFLPQRIKLNNILILFFLLVVLVFTRPVGIFFIPATFLYFLIKYYTPLRRKKIYMIGGAGLLIFFLLINFGIGSGGRLDFLLPYTRQMVLCEVPGGPDVAISVPHNGHSILDFIYLMIHYPGLFFRLAWLRFVSFFGVVRPFYSLLHNLFLAAYFYILYAIIIFFSKNLFRKLKAEVWFLIVPILLMAATVMLSCDEWSNRFLLGVAPFILLLAVLAVADRLEQRKEIIK